MNIKECFKYLLIHEVNKYNQYDFVGGFRVPAREPDMKFFVFVLYEPKFIYKKLIFKIKNCHTYLKNFKKLFCRTKNF